MQVYYSEIIRKAKHIDFSSLLKILPKKFFLAYIIQHKNLACSLKERLSALGFQVTGFKQILGCTRLPAQSTILLIGSGKFHALNLLKYSEKVIIFDGNQITELSAAEKDKIAREERAKFAVFLHAGTVGLLVSVKKGQLNLKHATNELKALGKKYPDKKFGIFLFDTLSHAELENFPVDFWLNFSCPGIEHDSKKIFDINTLKSLEN